MCSKRDVLDAILDTVLQEYLLRLFTLHCENHEVTIPDLKYMHE
jgi:hypothetical protein